MRVVDMAIRYGPPRLVWQAIAWRNYWRGEAELRILARLVDRGRAAVDVGAHKGVYTYHLARLCPRVWAYEPNPRLARFLKAAVGPAVEVRNVAVSDRAGEASLQIPVYGGVPNEGRASLDPARDAKAVRAMRITVETTRLDDEGLVDVGFVKIDVEGHEMAVLRGGEEVIRRDRPTLVVEIEERHLQVPIREVFAYIESLGYSGWFLLRGTLRRLSEFEPSRHQRGFHDEGQRPPGYVNNFIFVPR